MTVTPAIEAARTAGLRFEVVQIEPPSSAEESAERQGIELRQLIRTIVVRRGKDDYLFVLVAGGREIDWAKLRAHVGARRLSLPDRDEAQEVTGYERGAITPFGSKHPWPIVADATILAVEVVAIGAGQRGVNMHMAPADMVRAVSADIADVTKEGRSPPDASSAASTP
jgi:Cys-tRNA(Pro) deacylase